MAKDVDKVKIVECALGRLHVYYVHEDGATSGMTKLFVKKDKMHLLHALCPETITKTKTTITTCFEDTRDMVNFVAEMQNPGGISNE